MTPWEIQGRELANCNCAYGCPCQFNALPTDGTCEAAVGYEIDTGHYGDVKLDGLRVSATYKWPGAVHEGNGEYQLFIDENATPEQRDALEKIVTGEDTEEMATMWWIFTAMCSKKHPTQFRKITTDIDVDKRVGTVKVDGILDIMGEPIKNPVTGAEHRARIDLPNGFEYKIAEMGSASTTTTAGEISLIKNKDSYAQFAELHLNNSGVVR
jgi:hypothetical protein|tara:strand:- start:2542 stop:3177 length:636 start_codon:yes stop_codon:yes gene_type:complete